MIHAQTYLSRWQKPSFFLQVEVLMFSVKNSSGYMDKNKHTVYELCNTSVAHGARMTNLQHHLHLNHQVEYLWLYPPTKVIEKITLILLKWILVK